MNYTTFFLISMTCIVTVFYAYPSMSIQNSTRGDTLALQKNNTDVEKEIDAWLQRYFAKKLFKDDITYTPDLFNRIKQHLLTHGYIQYVPHKNLKKTVKHQVIMLQKKKHLTDKWISKHKKNIKSTIADYLKKHPHAQPQNIIEYLNNPFCKNKACRQIQEALTDQELVPELIKQTIKKIIKDSQK